MVVIVVAAISIHQSKKLDESWSVAARALHLMHHPGGFMRQRRLTGKIDGCHVVIETITRGGGKNSSKHTRYSVAYPRHLGLGLNLRKQGFLSGFAKAFGAQDIQLGDEAFDELVMVKGKDPVAVARFLTPNRRGSILRAMAQFDDLEINDAGVRTESSGHEDSFQILIRQTQRLVEFAGVISVDDVSQKPSAEAAAPAAWIPKRDWKAKQEPLDPPQAIPAIEPEPRSVVTSTPEAKPERTDNAPLNASEVGDSLFSGHHGIAETERRFLAEYADRQIAGHGIMKSWRATGFDFVFGADPCVIATIDLALPHSGSHGRGGFRIVLRLPAGTTPVATGSGYSFQGRMIKVDGLMRQLFVRGG